MSRHALSLVFLVACGCMLSNGTTLAGESLPPLGYYRMPAIHGDTIVFVAEGDLWRVPSSGGREEPREAPTYPPYPDKSQR